VNDKEELECKKHDRIIEDMFMESKDSGYKATALLQALHDFAFGVGTDFILDDFRSASTPALLTPYFFSHFHHDLSQPTAEISPALNPDDPIITGSISLASFTETALPSTVSPRPGN
jgi:hypothetical protein